MVGILIAFFLLVIMTVVGAFVVKLFRVDGFFRKYEKFWCMLPIIGALFLSCLLQLLTIFVNLKIQSMILGSALIVWCVYERKYLRSIAKKIFSDYKMIASILISLFIIGYPIWARGGLVTLQYQNNDIIFYLSSMDWLSNHNLLESVEFSVNSQYFWGASFMINQSRFGADLIGAFFMNLFQLQSHQIFSVVSVSYAMAGGLVCVFISEHVLKIPRRYGWAVLLIIMGCSTWSELLVFQYMPQILGISSLLAFFAFLYVFMWEDRDKHFLMVSLSIIGTLTIYAEFALYLLVIYLIAVIVKLCSKSNKVGERTTILKKVILAGIIAFIMNPLGLYKAAKYNFSILDRVVNGGVSIDPYSGNTMSIFKIIERCLGLGTIQIPAVLNNLLVKVLFAAVVVVALFIMFLISRKKIKSVDWYFIGTLTFFGVYTWFFHTKELGYQEYKHIISIIPFSILFIFRILNLTLESRGKVIIQSVTGLGVIIWGIAAIVNFNNWYIEPNIYVYDDELLQVRDGVNLVNMKDEIGVYGNHADIHGLMYALQDNECNIIQGSSSYFVNSDKAMTRYLFANNNDTSRFLTNSDSKIIWKNKKYSLIDNGPVFIAPIEGIYQPEFNGQQSFYWTSDQKTVLRVKNSSDNAESFRLYISTEKFGENNGHVEVWNGESVIGRGEVGETINTDVVDMEGKEVLDIVLTSDNKLEIPGNGDERALGFKIYNINVERIK